MRRNRIPGVAVLISILVILIVSAPTPSSAPLLDEIRFILKNSALKSPSPKSLAALKWDTLQSDIKAIDPYARLLPPTDEMNKSSSLSSLGIEVFSRKSKIWLRPDPGGPAAEAGVPEIAELREINKRKVATDIVMVSRQLDLAMRRSPIVLTVADSSSVTGNEYRIRPSVFKPPSVVWHWSGDWLTFRIIEFVSHETFPRIYATLMTQVRSNTRILLDLRGCSGGDFFEALDVAGVFISAGLPLGESYDRFGSVRIYRSPVGAKITAPLWVLIDSRTASAAEILAGTLQYHRRSLVVGDRSFGKCVSQTMVPLSNGGKFLFTNLGITFPDGTTCNNIGIKPDISCPEISVEKIAEIIKKLRMDRE